ncbi:MAG: hypothetical protein L0Z55_12670, partial [Planctomycetes bacterium]|nr:hypothetical protein [Planctomycetota bacterium]
LAAARRRAAQLEPAARARTRFLLGDLTRVRLRRRFPLVIAPFNVFMHLYTRSEFLAALATARAHLARGGDLAFDVRMPQPAELARDPERWYPARPYVHPADGRRYSYREAFRYDPVTQIQTIKMESRALAPPRRRRSVLLAHRQYFPVELEALLAAGGFSIAARCGDFFGAPLTAESESQILLATPARRRRRKATAYPANQSPSERNGRAR